MTQNYGDSDFKSLEDRAQESREACQTLQQPKAAYDEIQRLQSELTAARDEAEKLRARVAELEDSATDLVGAFDQTLTDTLNFEDYETLKRVVEPFRDIAASPESLSWLLRKQAEAVEVAVKELMPGPCWQPDDPAPEYTAACEMCADFRDHAQRLRQQAQSIENGE